MSYANPNRQAPGGSQGTQNRQNARQSAQDRQNNRQRSRSGSDRQPPSTATRDGSTALPVVNSSSAAPAAPAAFQQRQGGGSFSTVPGELINQGLGGLTQWGNAYGKDNETVGGLVHGAIADIYKTTANAGLAIQYNDAFLGSLGKYQAGQEDLKTGNTMRLMAAEGGIASSLLGQQGAEERANYREQGEQTRLGYRAQGEEQRAGYRTMGEQERLTQGDKTNQELRLRADARGAIRSQGARFYG